MQRQSHHRALRWSMGGAVRDHKASVHCALCQLCNMASLSRPFVSSAPHGTSVFVKD